MKLRLAIIITQGLSYLLIPVGLMRKKRKSVLHISYMVHIAFYTVKILRQNGVNADYLAIDGNGEWQSDYTFRKSYGHVSAKELFREFFFFWKVVSRYEIIHSHFMMTLTQSAWEMKFFRMLGGKWVVHGRGCAERDRELNMKLHPAMNICQDCDYNARICKDPINVFRRTLSKQQADHFFVTTPDMKDFVPHAEHIPFFFPPLPLPDLTHPKSKTFKIVHVTNHPGIEGTKYIIQAIDNLRRQGYDIDFVHLSKVSNDSVLEEYKTAHLSVGKMKMGYYANAQIESLYCGVPAITYVRKEFITPDIENSGLILADLDTLESTIRYFIDHPDKLEGKRRVTQSSVMNLHNNQAIAMRYKAVYEELLS
ncbi:MAG: hypothetical protein JST26_06120 [Bacteroidetes bacterium]|nr:hypothetical protein [Bacteroidota bacterium]